mgnify:CR=1 FL=1
MAVEVMIYLVEMYIGLVCYNNTALKTLEKCTDIILLKMCYQSTGTFYSNIDLDLSKCENLKSILLFHINFGVVKLPKSIEIIGHYVAGNSKLDASACDKLKTIEYSYNRNLEFLLNIKPFLLLEEIEKSLRVLLDGSFLLEDIKKVCGNTDKEILSIDQKIGKYKKNK